MERQVKKLCEQGELRKAMGILDTMLRRGLKVSDSMYVRIMRECGRSKALMEGKRLHCYIGSPISTYLANSLVDMYAKCGNIAGARRVFDRISNRNVFSWTIMISAYARKGGLEKESLALFEEMWQLGVKPDKVMYIAAIKVCGALADLCQGERVHASIKEDGLEDDPFVASALVGMYAKCGKICEAHRAFRTGHDTVAWNAMISALARIKEKAHEALLLFEQMRHLGFAPDAFTYSSALHACANSVKPKLGRDIHASIADSNLQNNLFVENSLVRMYSKCGFLSVARQVFERMHIHDVVSWSIIIEGYSMIRGDGYGAEEALSLYERMRCENTVKPDKVVFLSVLKACTSVSSLESGERVYTDIKKHRVNIDTILGNALIDMFAKCGSLKDAKQVFDGMRERDVVSWSAMMSGYAHNGLDKEAFTLFEQMQGEGVKPDSIVFAIVLNLCSHLGLVEEGRRILDSMSSQECSVKPSAEHYDCVIGLLGRMGHFAEAEDLINKMTCEPDVALWTNLLQACQIHGNLDLGRRAFDHLVKLNPQQHSRNLTDSKLSIQF